MAGAFRSADDGAGSASNATGEPDNSGSLVLSILHPRAPARPGGRRSGGNYRADIDGLRALAVAAVVFFHYGVPPFEGGFVGVDVFFVISGYVITSIVLKDIGAGRFSLASFYERRIRRIVPALFSTLLACSAVALILLMPVDLLAFGRSVAAASLFYSNIHFWQESGYFQAIFSDLQPLLHTWSLSIEAQFYIAFPIFFLLISRLGARLRAALLFVALGASLALSIVMVGSFEQAAFYLAPSRAWEFIVGAVIAAGAVPWFRQRLLLELSAAAGLGLIIWSAATFSPDMRFPGANALLPCLGAGLVILADERAKTTVGRLLSLRPIVYIGLISYSLYLWHWPVLVFTKYYLIHPITDGQTLGLIALSIALAALSARFIEAPFRRRAGVVTARRLVAGTTNGAIAIAAFGFVVQSADGWPDRLSNRARVVAAGAFDQNPRRDQCHSISPASVEQGALCKLGPGDAPPRFVVWGDSHGDALQPGVAAIAQEFGVSGRHATHTACPPVLGISDDEGCDRFNKAMMSYIGSNEIDVIILVARWNHYRENLAERLRDTVSALCNRVDEVVIVEQVPRLDHYGPSAMARLVEEGRSPEYYATPERVYQRRQQEVRAIFSSLEKNSCVRRAVPAELLCDSKYCKGTAYGRSLYWDDNHLSTFGSLYVRGIFVPLFARLKAKELDSPSLSKLHILPDVAAPIP